MRIMIFLAVCVLQSLLSFAQFAPNMISLSSDNGEQFFLYIDGAIKNNEPVRSINTRLYAQKADLKIVFLDKRIPALLQSVDLNSGYVNSFVLIKGRRRYFLEDISGPSGGGMNDSNYQNNHQWPGQNDNRYKPNGTMCAKPSLNNGAFIKLRKAITDAYPSYKKLDLIKAAFNTNCLSADQASALIRLLNNSADQIDVAKTAYWKIYDTENFDLVVNAVSDVYSRKSLRDYVLANHPGDKDYDENDDYTEVHDGRYPSDSHTGSFNKCKGLSLSQDDFAEALQTMRGSAFDDGKMSQAKLILKNHCLSVNQIRDMVKLFTFDTNKLEFAKYAYDHTSEQDKYYLVSQEFKSDFYKKDLTDFVNGKD